MTTLMLVDGQRGESRANAIIRRLRMEFARLGLSDSEAARRAGLSQDRMSRRMTGKTPFDVNDLDVICESLNISFGYVMTGARPIPGNDGPDGDGGVVRPKGFEPLTF
ncbi:MULTISPECIES: helix-turn-helix domain-containing protein, partial [Mycobacteroides]